ncbi:ADP-ribosylglycohydrolase family protein [Streptobacillus canis]|uniref:ADP-ribosylglycohydrolase family protein n=1 Tax=Streptobacillus canis TaxID=2678686 RepID=UPI0012E2E617|nr:ADP-ribosylglycohydrolase family protein [Streptobacillus canis]
MLGAIIGDIIGSPYEFDQNNIKTTIFPLFSEKSCFTDDTVMSIAVADGLIAGYGNEELTEKEIIKAMKKWAKEYPNAGYGLRFSQWVLSDESTPYNSFGNGSAMRVSACAWLYNNLRDVEKYAEISARITHNHPEGIKGAKATAAAIFLARMGATKEYIKNYIIDTYEYIFKPCDEIRPDYHHVESCQETVPEAFAAFFEGNSFEEVIRLAISLGGDSDTLAAIAGSIAEAYYGIDESLSSEAFKYLDENTVGFLTYYYEALSGLRAEKIAAMNKIMEYKPFFDKREIVRWLPTNNRKTPEFFADYGQEVNDLIKLMNTPNFADFGYQKTIKRLKINSFKEAIPTANMLGLRAMLTSIIRRERFGVGTISRAIADGLVSEILERYQEIVNNVNI